MPRPKLKPSEEQRRLVKSLAAMGTKHADIARMIDIRSPKTLRKHFRVELDRGALEANSNVAQSLYGMATSGKNCAATIFWLKTRAHWRERGTLETGSVAVAPFIVSVEKEPTEKGQP